MVQTNGNSYNPDIITDRAFAEIKSGISAVRSVRDSLVQLVKMLVVDQERNAYLVLVEPRVSIASLKKELTQFNEALRPEVAKRIFLLLVIGDRIDCLPPEAPGDDLVELKEKLNLQDRSETRLPRADVQSEVLKVILNQWFRGSGPLTSAWLSETVGCSYRTVAAMIEKLEPAIERLEDRSVQLKYFPQDVWARFLAMSEKSRSLMRFADRSGQPRSPLSLITRLRQFKRKEIAVGGVAGALYHHPDLDLSGIPRLDLSIHAPGGHVDLEFMKQLDPALKPGVSSNTPANVVLHFVRRKESLFEADEAGNLWADPVECLADLTEARLDAQATDFLAFLSGKRKRE